MPGNPIAKSQRIAALSERFDQLVFDFGKLIPPCYRYKGQPSTGDARADAWAAADHNIITAMIDLHELCDVLDEHAKRPATVEPNADGELVEPTETE